MKKELYSPIFKHYEKTLLKYGENFKGMDWPNEIELSNRFEVMYNLFQSKLDSKQKTTLLDLGCGIGLFINYLNQKEVLDKVNYLGVDISNLMINTANKLKPNYSFETRDILQNPFNDNEFDYVIMNGVLTEKVSISQEDMISFAKNIILNAFKSAKTAIAFNVMSTYVDWEREDLFHWSVDDICKFLIENCSRNIKINMDYGLYELTVYVYKEPNI